LEEVAGKAVSLGAKESGLLVQTDTFYRTPHARLKIREFGDGKGELISYRRPDVQAARGCDYVVCPVSDPLLLKTALRHALDETGVVRKKRRLFLLKNTRIHLDEVEGLGSFVELETVLAGLSDEEGKREMEAVAADLGLDPADSVPKPYVELLAAKE